MPRIPFQKPKKVEWEILSDRYGRLVAEPFEKGYALTVGNSLRRTLLSIVPGAAVAWVKIDGVRSADAKIPGVVESTVDVLLNLKKLSVQVPSQEPRVVRLEVTGPKTVTGDNVPEDDVEIMNPELTLFTVEKGARVSMELGIGVGRGYEAADGKRAQVPAGGLPLDAAFSPITRVSYNVEMSRLGKPLEELALPARAINALKGSEIHLVADLVQKTETDLVDVKNLGEKSIDEIKTALAALGLSLGMRIDPGVLGALGRGTPAGGVR
jgi:DNA-directed RNA polymerase alpha subunit